jgi:curved DNA-binding protein CbpA
LIEGVNILALAIGPEEAFVLSRIDGRSDEKEIALATGLGDERVLKALRRLADVGAIEYPRGIESETGKRPTMRSAESLAHEADATLGAVVLLYDPKELEENVEIEPAKRRLILEKYYRINSLNHYEALGITRDADRKAVKTAYYELVATIHPDKYFGKNLGSFRSKMEKCFERVTQAYDVLSRQATREEYDAYLHSQQQVADLQRALDMRVTPEELDRLELELLRLVETTPSSSPPRGRENSLPPTSAQMEPRASVRLLTEQERRQALANALRRSPSGLRQSMSPAVSSSRIPKADSKASNDGLKYLYETKIQHARQAKLKVHLQAAQEALDRNDPVSACNSLRIAQQLAPDDAALGAHLNAVQGQANSVLAERLLEQARYEERHESYEAASRNYARAAEVRPTLELWENAARCALRAKFDLRMAAEMAKKAIELNPQRADLHALLAEIYLEAQLSASAAAELERAARLAPKDDSIRELRRRLERVGN